MAFDVFALRDQVVGEYHAYFESFVNVRDQEINSFIRAHLDDGELWPDAVLERNLAHESGVAVADLVLKALAATTPPDSPDRSSG